MDILKINKKAWDVIGARASPPALKQKKYLQMLHEFCTALPKHATVLDVGCGPGLPFTKTFIQKGFRVTGVDLSETMIALAQKNVPEASYVCKSMTEIDFENEFDGAFSGYSMLCLDPAQFTIAASNIVKSLKKGGWFFLTLNEPSPEGHDEDTSLTIIMGQQIYSRPYSESEIRAIFSKLGMSIINVQHEHTTSVEYGDEDCLLVFMRKTK